MSSNGGMVTLDDAKEQVRKVCERLALLHFSYAKTLQRELGEKKGKELVLKAIKHYGMTIGQKVKAKAVSQGLELTPANYKEDLPSYGMHDRIEWMEVGGEKRMRAFGCVMGKVWNELDENKLGRLYCYVDPAKYMAFNPVFKLIHTKTLLDGDKCCEFAVRHATEEEKSDFANDEKDWSYIDR